MLVESVSIAILKNKSMVKFSPAQVSLPVSLSGFAGLATLKGKSLFFHLHFPHSF